MTPDEVVKVISSLELDCTDPQHTSREYVTHEMAIDAGDKDLEGSISREEEWKRCGACPNCMFNQVKAEIITNLQDYQKLREKIHYGKFAQILHQVFTEKVYNEKLFEAQGKALATYLQQPTEH
jgi:hypothetical protein